MHAIHTILLVTTLAANAADPSASQPAQPRRCYNFNRGWEFFRPADPVPFVPARTQMLASGDFPQGTKPIDITFTATKARFVCLESLSAYAGVFASVAEFSLLDPNHQTLSRDGWKIAYADSEEIQAGDLAINAIDGKADTNWHTQWHGKSPVPPHSLVIDLGAVRGFSGFRYLPRQDGNPSGMIKSWRFYACEAPFPLPDNANAEGMPPDSAKWEHVNLPHSVRLEPRNASGGKNYQGVCWYRKTLVTDPSWSGKKIYLRFEGAMQVAEISLNGKPVTTHFGGYQPFTIDLTSLLGPAGTHNSIVVKLDNSDNPEVPPGKPQNQLDFCYFGGLYRDVRLEVMDSLHISDEILANRSAAGGIFVTYPEVAADKATVAIQADVENESASARDCKVRQDLIAADGTVVASTTESARLLARSSQIFHQSLTVVQPKLWHPEHPDLYNLRTTILDGGNPVDNRTTRIGIRRIAFTPAGMTINGEKYFALGVNRHQDHPYVGYALPHSANYRDARKLREAGFTSFRSHYPQDPSFMDACDELGILCVVSNPGWQFFGNKTFVSRVYQDAREMVRRDRNHACVALWEPILNETAYPESFCREVHQIIHEEFPGPHCYTAGDGNLGGGSKILDVLYSHRTDAKPSWVREWGDGVDNWGDQQSKVRVDRAWGEVPQLVQAMTHLSRLDDILSGSGGDPARTYFGGACLWAGIDCYRGYHHQPFYGAPLDLFRLPKFDYQFFRSQRPPAVILANAESGPMVHIANFLTYYSPADITIFSNCEEVSLSKNGKLVETRKPEPGYHVAHPPFLFRLNRTDNEKSTYYMTPINSSNERPEELKAEGKIGGKVVATHIVKAPGVMRSITLEADYAGRDLTADGADWIRVYAHICDGNGTTHPLADDNISFTAEGEGSILGDMSIGANPVRAEAGIATALVRASETAGKITVRASAFGLTPATLTLESKPATGLAR